MKKNKEISVSDIWNKGKADGLGDFILAHSKKQSPERLLKNKLLSIQYQIEDYIEGHNSDKKLMILDFVKMYLKALNVTHKRLAELFEMKDSNLHKYLVGERKLNTAIVLKLSSFSHTDPEYWLRVEVKNEMIEINRERQNTKDYQKYDYQNLLVPSEY